MKNLRHLHLIRKVCFHNLFNIPVMHPRCFFFAILIFFSSILNAQKPTGFNFDQSWQTVKSLEEKDLPESQSEIVNSIYSAAKAEKNHPQLLKSILYQIRIEGNKAEEPLIKAITRIRNEITASEFPSVNILHSMLARLYWQYYEYNRYRFLDRTQTLSFGNTDVSTWSLEQLVDQTIRHFNLSLENAGMLQKIPVGQYKDILTGFNKLGMELWPTLYDFLANSAVGFYTNREPFITKPVYSFTLDRKEYFLDAKGFIRLSVDSRDSISYKYNALKIFQDLLRFHIHDSTPDILIDVDLKRLAFVHGNSGLPDKDSLYLKALRELESRYLSSPASALVSYRIASFWNGMADKYQPLQSQKHKWDRKKAFDICTGIISRFPESDAARQAYNLQKQIQSRGLSAVTERANLPEQPFRALVNFRNIPVLYWRIVPSTYNEIASVRRHAERSENTGNNKDFIHYFLQKKPVRSGKVNLPTDGDFQRHSTEIKLDAPGLGNYIILFGSDENFSMDLNAVAFASTVVSDLAYMHRNRTDGSTDIYVTGRKTGEAIAGAEVRLAFSYYNDNTAGFDLQFGSSFITNKEGYVNIPYQSSGSGRNQNFFSFIISHKGDSINSSGFDFEGNMDNTVYQQPSTDTKDFRTFFFLDRSIYRPGQTLYYKGLHVVNRGNSSEIVKNKQLTVTFYDANHQVVTKQKVTTSDFGTFNGTFTTPSAGMRGVMYLETEGSNDSRVYFSVEEYKRPKFEVKFDTVKGIYHFHDTVTVNGKALAYAGPGIPGATVQYRVVRRVIFPLWAMYRYRHFPESAPVEITNGTAVTGSDGTFDIRFRAIPDESISPESHASVYYEVTADVTDINGETHSSAASVNVGYTAISISVEMKNIDQGNPADLAQTFVIRTVNRSGNKVPASGTITLQRLKNPSAPLRERVWERPDTQMMSRDEFKKFFPYDPYKDEENFHRWEREVPVYSFSFNTAVDSAFTLKDVKKWTPGKYLLTAVSKDPAGKEVKEEVYFDVTDRTAKKLPAPAFFSVTDIKDTGEPGEKAAIVVGSSGKVRYLFEIEHDGKILEKKWSTLKNGQNLLEIPIKEEYRGNITVHLVTITHNRMYAVSQLVTVPYTNKQLDIRFETFRDKLQPGQEEQWKIIVSPKTGEKQLAEMVATLYDASLDAFRPHQWHAEFFRSLYSRMGWQSTNGFDPVYFGVHDVHLNDFKSRNFEVPEYPMLDWFGYSYAPWSWLEGISSPGHHRYKKVEAVSAMVELEEMNLTKAESPFVVMDSTVPVQNLVPRHDFNETRIRKNFNETAFFYPGLRTNEKGEIIINFTIPEALTRWKMLGFAHTQDLKSGLVQKELVTQKDLMIVPNQPRFFREKDQMTFRAKVTGMTDQDLTGQARLEFFDALTMKPVDSLMGNTNNIRDFTLKARQSTDLQWDIRIPDGLQAVSYRIVARAGQFSDGEEMILPVVSNRILVTETMPVSIRGSRTKTFRFEKLLNDTSSTLRHHRYTFEFTTNPAWYAVQALPYLMEYPYECTEQVFSRFYANSLASYIANSDPRIKQVFDTWANLRGDALLSNLEKNQELKTALLQETPWVLQAKDESQRKKNIALLFDLNRMANEQEKALKQLANTQLGNGGFPWFPGLPEDLYITQYIVAGIGHLKAMGISNPENNPELLPVILKAIDYMDKEMDKAYKRLAEKPEALKRNNLSYSVAQYLYARSFFSNIPLREEYLRGKEYWQNQAVNNWPKVGMYARGMIALAFHRQNDKQIPGEIVQSLKENAVTSAEQGMYWRQTPGYYWYQSPTEIQALMIEVFDEIANDSRAVEDMKVWLLTQKQNQDWRTTKATAEACYALLKRGTGLLKDTNIPEITVGGERLEPEKSDDFRSEVGTGYFKTAWTAPEITPALGNITVEKKSEGLSWGAAYWQYFEVMEKITPAATPLKLSRKLFKEVNSDRGKVIIPVSDSTRLHVGDLVKVRIEIRSDRTMEYIHLKDMRAGAFEPVETLSGYKYQDGLWYYQSPGDVSTSFFIGYLPRGTYVFEYPLRVSQAGSFSGGLTTIQCMYAPEFSSHSEGGRVEVR